jgi:hypothetical protein
MTESSFFVVSRDNHSKQLLSFHAPTIDYFVISKKIRYPCIHNKYARLREKQGESSIQA